MRRLLQMAPLRAISIVGAASVVMTGASLVSGFFIARQLDSQQYGQYAFMASVYLLMLLGLGFGLTSQIVKDIAERHRVTPQHYQQQVSGVVALRFLTALLAAAGGGLATLVSGTPAYACAGVAAACAMSVDFMVGISSALNRLRSVVLLLCMQQIVLLGCVLVFRVTTAAAVYRIFLISHCCTFVYASIQMALLREPRLVPRFTAIVGLQWRNLVAGQVYLVVLLQTAYSTLGISMLGALGAFSAAGELSIAMTLARLVPLLAGTITTVLYYPRLCAYFSDRQYQGFSATVSLALELTTLIAAGGAAFLLVYADVLVPLLYTNRHLLAVPLLRVLAVLCFFGVADLVLTWPLVAEGRSWWAVLPLLVRVGLLALGWPIALSVGTDLQATVVAGVYTALSGMWLGSAVMVCQEAVYAA